MTPIEQLLSFTGKMTFKGKPVESNYNRLSRIIFDKTISDGQREIYRKQLEQFPEHLVTSEEGESELFYFERLGDRYHLYSRAPGPYKGFKLSMEGTPRTWSTYSGNNSTGFIIINGRSTKENLSVEDLTSDQIDVYFLAGGKSFVYPTYTQGAPVTFTDEEEDGDNEYYRDIAYFELTIIDRNIAL